MKQCALCAHTRPDGHLWCQQPYCPAEQTVSRLRVGDWIGEMGILQWVVTLPAATVYRAKRGDDVVLLKVAHVGFEDKLKREARFLQSHSHAGLPTLLSAHSDTVVSQHPYGQVTLNNQLLTYLILDNIEGRMLNEWLMRNPQPWHRLIGWILSGLTDVMAYFHSCQLFHFALSPTMILIRFDSEGVPRPTLLDFGLCASFEDIGRYWRPQLVHTSYLAPELRHRQPVSEQTDVYGLGRILQLMLTGSEVNGTLRRPDLRGLPQLANHSVSADVAVRPLNTLKFAQELLASCEPLPSEDKPTSIKTYAWWGVVISIILIAGVFLILLV